MDGILGGGAVILGWRLAPAEQSGVVQISMFRGMQTAAGRIVWSGPAFPVVVQVAEHVEMFLPAGRTGVEPLAAGKLHSRDDEMQLMVASMGVPHPEDVVLIRLQASKGDLFKIVHDPLLLFRCHHVVRMTGKHSGSEFPFGVQRVDEVTGGFHIPAQDFRRQLIPARIIRAHKIMSRAVTTALTVRKNLHEHGESSESGGGGVSVSLNSRSRLTRADSTSIVSARLLWMFTQRAS